VVCLRNKSSPAGLSNERRKPRGTTYLDCNLCADLLTQYNTQPDAVIFCVDVPTQAGQELQVLVMDEGGKAHGVYASGTTISAVG